MDAQLIEEAINVIQTALQETFLDHKQSSDGPYVQIYPDTVELVDPDGTIVATTATETTKLLS